MYDMYGPTYTTPVPLTRDPAIYWLGNPWFFEREVSYKAMERGRINILARVHEEIGILARRKALELGWAGYTTIVKEENRNWNKVIRFELYEQPSFREVKVWLAPHSVYELRLQPQGGEPITLPLRRLMCRGERARGALYDDILHLFLPTVGTQTNQPTT